MNTTERNWSAIRDHLNGRFGQRAFYTRQDWIEQCCEWCYGGMPDKDLKEDELSAEDIEEREYLEWLNEISDEELMLYISENWEIEIRETTWLKEDNECYWRNGDNGVVVKILEVELNDDGELTEFTDILCEHNGKTCKLPFFSLYGLTDEKCPKCGSPLYVSDLCQYQCVCLKCDENFY